LDQDFSWVVSE